MSALAPGTPARRLSPSTLANISRPDLNGKGFPNLEHGFVFSDLASLLPSAAWKNPCAKFDVRGLDPNGKVFTFRLCVGPCTVSRPRRCAAGTVK